MAQEDRIRLVKALVGIARTVGVSAREVDEIASDLMESFSPERFRQLAHVAYEAAVLMEDEAQALEARAAAA